MRYVLVLLVLARTATADPVPPPPPASDLGKRVVEKVVDATNGFFEHNIDRLSHDLLVVRVDANEQRAKIGLGGGIGGYRLRLASNVQVVDGTARIAPRLAVAVAGRSIDLTLPTVDVAATSYRGERGVEVRLPLVRRTF
jgi:hypothetical protein